VSTTISGLLFRLIFIDVAQNFMISSTLMRAGCFFRFLFAGLTGFFSAQIACAADSFALVLRPTVGGVELSWPVAITNVAQSSLLPEYEVEYSADLQNWTPIGGKVRGIEGLSGPFLGLSLHQQSGSFFIGSSPISIHKLPTRRETEGQMYWI